MKRDRLNKAYDEIESHLKAFNLPSMHVTALAGLLMADVVGPEIRHAINAALEEAAVEIEKLERGVYTSAQTPAGLVRAMKVT